MTSVGLGRRTSEFLIPRILQHDISQSHIGVEVVDPIGILQDVARHALYFIPLGRPGRSQLRRTWDRYCS